MAGKTKDAKDVWVDVEDVKGREKLLAEAQKQLQTARVVINMSFVFYGSLLNYISDEFMWPEEFPDKAHLTAFTDGDRIVWNPMFVVSLNPNNLCFVLEHEVMHIINNHIPRLGSRHPEVWNMACDYAINYIICQTNRGFTDKNVDCVYWEPPKCGLYDEKYDGKMNADDIYEELMKEAKANKGKIKLKGFGQSKGNSSDKPGEFQMDGDGDGGEDGQEGQGGSADGKAKKGKGGKGKLSVKEKTIQDIEKANTSIQNPEDPEIKKSRKQDGEYDSDKYGADKDLLWKERTHRAVTSQQAATGIGSMPEALGRLIDKVLKPKINWATALAGLCHSITKNDSTWRRLNRRWIGRGLALPTLYKEELGEVVVIIDDSGSCYGDVPQFISEAIAIFDEFKNCKVRLVRCDTHPTHVCDWEPGLDDPIFEPNVCVGHGGGTSFVRPFSELLPSMHGEWNPEAIVYLTDLDGEIPGDEFNPGVPVLWVCNNERHDQSELAFGDLVIFDRKLE